MPTWLLIVLVVLGTLILLLAVGGAIANSRRQRRRTGRFELHLDEVNRQLASAHANDKGWERGALEAAARQAFEHKRPGVELLELALVQVVDRPGTDEDQAVFRCVSEAGESRLTMGRVEGRWVGEDLV